MLKFKILTDDFGKRADIFVADKLPKFSRSSLSGLFDTGFVTLGSVPVKPSHKLKRGEVLQIDDSLLKIRPPIINMPIIYEDDDVIVINKPAGILTHSKGAINIEATVASFIQPKLADKNLIGNRAGIVHRLDRGTSGVIVTARTEDALKWLQRQFSTRKSIKTYLAIVQGTPDPAEAIIDAPIERNPKRPQSFQVGSSGRPAKTHYKVLKELTNTSIIELHPYTGRTHQLRVHLKYIGHPIVGDHVYGREAENLLLHAKSLELTLPSGRRMVFKAPLPSYFKNTAQK